MDFVVGIIGTAIIAIALCYTSITFKRNSQTEEMRLSKEIVNDLDNLDKDLPDVPDGDKERLAMWEQRLFNRLEWLSLLMNNNRIKLEELREYFQPLVISWYKDGFLKYAEESDKEDPNKFKELKKLYKSLTDTKPPENKIKQKLRKFFCRFCS